MNCPPPMEHKPIERLTDRELQSLRNRGNLSEAAADEIVELRARLDELEKDAARYRAVRELGSQLKVYVYDDENDPCSGDWLYKPSPEQVDAFADEIIAKGGLR